jgi:hypothetical protein
MWGLIRRLAKEPLVRCLAIGAVLFAIVGRGGTVSDSAEIVVARADIDLVAAGFAAAWQPPPSENELRNAPSVSGGPDDNLSTLEGHRSWFLSLLCHRCSPEGN